jgi:hypothetical protein
MDITGNTYYRKGDLKEHWEKYKIYSPDSLKKNPFFHIFKTYDIDEAEIVAMRFIRDVGATLDSTYYDVEKGLLYLNYGNTMTPIPNRKVTAEMIKELMEESCIKNITVDGLGQPLFLREF